MAEHDRPLDAETGKRPAHEIGLRPRRPQAPVRALAVAIAGSVDGDDAISACEAIDEAADDPVVHHRAVAVEEHEGRALAGDMDVHADAVDIDDAAGRRVAPLGPFRPGVDSCGGRSRRDGARCEEWAEAASRTRASWRKGCVTVHDGLAFGGEGCELGRAAEVPG